MIAINLSEKHGEMVENVMANGTRLDVSTMVEIVVRILIARNVRMIWLSCKQNTNKCRKGFSMVK